jgi:2-hydroxycyclohexanecarboxyl-CoA dehydrogenase
MTATPSRPTPPVPLPLPECSVLITGGTSGVGLETAIQLALAGVQRIAINGRNLERGAAARVQVLAQVALRAPGHPAPLVEFVAGDCNSATGALAVCEAARQRLGSVDVLVNSTVGPYAPTLLHKTALDDVEKILTTQMMAPLLTTRIVLPWMAQRGRGGAIINIASDAGKVTTPGESIIGAAMAGIIMFSRTAAIEAKRHGVRINVLTPSLIEDTATYGRVMADEFSAKLFGKAVQMAQLGVVKPADMAALIVFLAGPQAAKITGQAISCNGGISAA